MAKLDNTQPLNPNSVGYVRNIAKQVLKNHMFIGCFKEKRFVDSLNTYRDVIKVADNETKFITDLKAIRKRIREVVPPTTWIGITEPHLNEPLEGYNLWVQLKEEIFGSYWFNVENVKFENKEIYLKLKIVREVSTERSFHNSVQETTNNSEFSFLDETKLILRQHLNYFFTNIITVKNIKESIVFLFLTLATIFTFAVQISQWLLEYFLKLVHEMSTLLRVLTPIFESFFRMIIQIINGFYLLVAMLWRDSKTKKIESHSAALLYENKYSQSYGSLKRRLPIGFRQNQNYYVTEVE